jgi:hypothetical protein
MRRAKHYNVFIMDKRKLESFTIIYLFQTTAEKKCAAFPLNL